MKKAKGLGMPAVAITDHGNLYGAIEFYQEAEKAGIKPIIGCEVYMAPGKISDRNATSGRDAAHHFTLLSKDATGYANLVKLVSTAHLDGMYYKPRIDKEILAQHSEGLIGLSGCLKGEINMHILSDQLAKARQSTADFRDILGPENFFLEMHDHGIEAQRKCNLVLPGLAKEFGLGLVAANDVHFLERSHHEAHDVLICIGTGANVADERRLHYVPELYFKTPAEMQALFREYPEAITNTLRIAERCDLKLEFGIPKYPNYNPPTGKTQNQYLRDIVEAGMIKRYGSHAESEEVQKRYALEISVLEKQGFVNYFLIVWDFINWAKERDIPVGPGRGSAAGSMIAYAMGITDIDPLKFKLLFERFLNPERVSPPDIDVDFCPNRRAEVIDYVRHKYGERAVAQIITFGTLGAKSVIRDVGRVLGWNYSDADRIAKMIPNELNITLKGFDKKDKATGEMKHEPGAIDKNPELKKAVETEPATAQLWGYATVLEGLTRNTGVHAAGVVISDRNLSEYIPLTRGNEGGIVSQYSMSPVGELGMLKMDFLGLKTLTVITDAVTLIRKKNPEFNIDTVPLNDRKTFDVYNRGDTIAVFQVESGGMVNVCRQFDVNDIEDVNAILALYRPGPMDLIPQYIKRKKGLEKIKYLHPLLEKVTAETYGILIYQEQVMQAVQVLGGYTLGGADLLRRAMGKKDVEKMAKERKTFVEGCERVNQIPEKKANEIFDLLEKFAGYGFNRSHSAAYAWVSYQTAYLKGNYPVEFMAAVLSNEVSNTEKIAVFVGECQRMGIAILPPDVNRSSLKFSPEYEEGAGSVDPSHKSHESYTTYGTNGTDAPKKLAIRFGLAAIKNVGEAAMEAAIAERERGGLFKSLEDFCKRVDPRKINKKVLESLVKCGAFDFTGEFRSALFAEIDGVLAAAASSHRDRASGQVSLFDDLPSASVAPKRAVSQVAPWPQAEMLAFEKELLGFYVTGHPLDEYRPLLEGGKYKSIASLVDAEEKATVQIAGAFTVVEKKFTKKDSKPFAIVTLEDFTGSVEVMIWNDAYGKCAAYLEPARVVSVTGRLDKREDTPRIVATEIKPLKSLAPAQSPETIPVLLSFNRDQTTESVLQEVKSVVDQFPGSQRLDLEFVDVDGGRVRMRAAQGVRFSSEFREKLESWLVK